MVEKNGYLSCDGGVEMGLGMGCFLEDCGALFYVQFST
jgi:hypothetical protein